MMSYRSSNVYVNPLGLIFPNDIFWRCQLDEKFF